MQTACCRRDKDLRGEARCCEGTGKPVLMKSRDLLTTRAACRPRQSASSRVGCYKCTEMSSAHLLSRAPSRGRLESASMSKNTSVPLRVPLYQHVRAESVSPRIKALAACWQVWNSEQEGDCGSERVLVVSGRATVIPNDGSPSFNVGPGDAVYFMCGFQCTWRIHEAPLVQRYGYFGFDGKEIKETHLTCDVCGNDCYEESYLYNDDMDICPRCFQADARSAQQYEEAEHQRWGEAVAEV